MRWFDVKGWAPRVWVRALAGMLLGALAAVCFAGCGASATGANASDVSAAVTTTATTTAPTLTATTALSPAHVPSVTVGAALKLRPVAAGYLGLSLDYYVVPQYGGTDPANLNQVFLQLVRNLAPGQRPVLRVGGDSTDWLWLPTAGVKRVGGLKEELTTQQIKILAAVATALNAKLLLGINLEADSTALARHMADALVSAVGASHVEALELGNEPELYAALGWYANSAGKPVYGRAKGYSIADYTREFDQIAKAVPDVGLAGPASGSAKWDAQIGSFVRGASKLKVVTVHAYPMQTCGTHPGLSTWPTIAKLLSSDSSLALAASVKAAAAAAHSHGKLVRVDETNSVSCFGLKGVSNTYAAALWSIESAFQFARVGIDGLNLTTLPAAAYRLWELNGSTATVSPQYYGLLDFADAVPAGSKLLATPDTGTDPEVFAVRTPSGQTHVVIVNAGAARKLAVRVSGGGGGEATATYLSGPSLSATSGVTLGGQSFGASTSTGTLGGTATGVGVTPVHGAYVVRLPAHSATTLSIG